LSLKSQGGGLKPKPLRSDPGRPVLEDVTGSDADGTVGTVPPNGDVAVGDVVLVVVCAVAMGTVPHKSAADAKA
jgi:hypothetical protein